MFGRIRLLFIALVSALVAVLLAAGADAQTVPWGNERTPLGATDGRVEWGGRAFSSVSSFQAYSKTRGISWTRLINRRPGILDAFGIPYVRWNGRTFQPETALKRHLVSRGVSWQRFVRTHPDVIDTLRSCGATCQVADVLWQADHEKNLKEWDAPSEGPTGSFGGGFFNSGVHALSRSTEVAHSGRASLKAVISTPPQSGVRAFRWRELKKHRALYFGAWFYVPRSFELTADPLTGQFWNIFQFKS